VIGRLVSRTVKVRIYRTTRNFFFLHMILYGCKTWSLTLREEHRLSVFENTC
jgi:hypothetical protein